MSFKIEKKTFIFQLSPEKMKVSIDDNADRYNIFFKQGCSFHSAYYILQED